MHPMAARAFLAIHLSPGGREKFRAYEQSVVGQSGRYLTGFEIVRCLQKRPENPQEHEAQKMEDLWIRYEKEHLWPARRFEEEHPEVVPLSKLEEIYEWEDYAVGQYLKVTVKPDTQQPGTDLSQARMFQT